MGYQWRKGNYFCSKNLTKKPLVQARGFDFTFREFMNLKIPNFIDFQIIKYLYNII